MLALQFIVSIIYLGSWLTFFFVRVPRVLWGWALLKWKFEVFTSHRGICLLKAEWILRLSTLALYVCLALGFSVWLPEQFCELIGEDKDSFTSCKWQVFGFRIIFILLSLPMELLALAVVYRHATDMIFKLQLRKLTGGASSDLELHDRKKKGESIGYLMDPDVVLNRRALGSYNQAGIG